VPASQTGAFFISWLLVGCLLLRPLVFLRIPQLLVFEARYSTTGLERAQRRLTAPPTCFFGAVVGNQTLVRAVHMSLM
jgi:hypothetical protein